MAVKPGTLPSIWASNALYTTGPFIGLASKSPTPGPIAADGHRPGAANPTAAEYQNYEQHWLSQWVSTWLALGSSAGAADAHIVETTAAGRTAVVGLNMTDAVDEVVGTWTGANTAVPMFIVTTGGGGGFQVTVGGAGGGSAFYAAMTNAGAGTGFLFNSILASSASVVDATVNGTGGFGSMVATNNSATGLLLQTVNTTALTLRATNTGAPLNLVPKSNPSVPVPGDMNNDAIANVLTYWNSVGQRRRVWGSEFGLDLTIATNNVASSVDGGYVQFNYNFEAGKRYRIAYGFNAGRSAAGTKSVLNFFNIGGAFSPAAASGITLGCFEAGAAGQYELFYKDEYVYTAGFTALLVVQLFIATTAGAGTIQRINGYIVIQGIYD